MRAQLALELNFGDRDNYVFQKDRGSGEFTQSFVDQKYFRTAAVSRLGKRSPSGGHYLSLDGESQFMKLPATHAIEWQGDVSFSLSFWIFLESALTNGEIINSDNGILSGYRLYLEDNRPVLELREGMKDVFLSDIQIEPNRWTHIGVVCDGLRDSVHFYQDGEPESAHAFQSVSQIHSGATTYVGAWATNASPNYLKAHLDQLRFFVGQDTVFETIRVENASRQQERPTRRKGESLFTLQNNYPNPFNLSTTIAFELRQQGEVELKVFDLLGNAVRVLHIGTVEAGVHQFTWDGADTRGNVVPSGIYFVRLSFNGLIQTKKVVLVK